MRTGKYQYPKTSQVGPPRGVLPAQGVVALYPEKRMIHYSLAAWDNASFGW